MSSVPVAETRHGVTLGHKDHEAHKAHKGLLGTILFVRFVILVIFVPERDAVTRLLEPVEP